MGAASRCVDKKQTLLYSKYNKISLLLGEGKGFPVLLEGGNFR